MRSFPALNTSGVRFSSSLERRHAPEQRPGIEAMTDTQMVGTAFHSTGSFIVVAALKLEGKYP
jgi:hypothetical protein